MVTDKINNYLFGKFSEAMEAGTQEALMVVKEAEAEIIANFLINLKLNDNDYKDEFIIEAIVELIKPARENYIEIFSNTVFESIEMTIIEALDAVAEVISDIYINGEDFNEYSWRPFKGVKRENKYEGDLTHIVLRKMGINEDDSLISIKEKLKATQTVIDYIIQLLNLEDKDIVNNKNINLLAEFVGECTSSARLAITEAEKGIIKKNLKVHILASLEGIKETIYMVTNKITMH